MKRQKFTTNRTRRVRVIVLFMTSLIFLSIAAGVALLGFYYVQNKNFKETFYCVSSLKVNNKIRVLQISDLHECVFGKDNKDLIQRIEKLSPDIILYTGDIINSDSASEEQVVKLCSTLCEQFPSYYIYGNNEVEKYYDTLLTQEALDEKFGFNDENRDPEKLLATRDVLTEKLEAVGVKVLKNSVDTITVGKTTVDIFGVLTSNPSAFWSYAGNNFNTYLYTNENHLKITAIHEPTVFETYEPDTWGDLMLAGHTHGGIARIPLVGPVYTREGGILPERNGCYVYGRDDVQGRPLIVSSGLDNSNIFRMNNQPEIVVVDINKF